MALTEDRVLVSYEINVSSGTVSILWHDRILRGEDVISSVNHRGAYELVNGDLPDYIKQEFNISMASLTSAAVVSLTQAKSDISEELLAAKQHIQLLESSMTNKSNNSN